MYASWNYLLPSTQRILYYKELLLGITPPEQVYQIFVSLADIDRKQYFVPESEILSIVITPSIHKVMKRPDLASSC